MDEAAQLTSLVCGQSTDIEFRRVTPTLPSETTVQDKAARLTNLAGVEPTGVDPISSVDNRVKAPRTHPQDVPPLQQLHVHLQGK